MTHAFFFFLDRSFYDVGRDPAYRLLYAMLLLLGSANFSRAAFELCAYSDQYVARLLGVSKSMNLISFYRLDLLLTLFVRTCLKN